MIPGSFEYHRPGSLGEAVGLVARLGDESRVMAGGHSLVPMMKLRLAAPEHVIDLQDVNELRGISIDGGTVTIGAMVTQREIVECAALTGACSLLRETALQIADPQVRYCGTVGGNLANGDAGNDMPAAMQALDAAYVLAGSNGTRRVSSRTFYHGPYATARADDEILTAIEFPVPPRRHGAAYCKQKRKIGDYATAAAAVVLSLSGETCESAAVSLTNVGDTTLFAEEAGSILAGSRLDADTIARAADAAKAIARPEEDPRGPPDYRRHIAGVMVRRAVEASRDQALAVTGA